MPDRKLRVFLCHAKEDKPTVREIYRQLTDEGWTDVWLDEVKLLPGQEWDIEIEKAVEQADVVVVCLSSHSVDKEGYVQKELRFVLNIADEKTEGTIFVVPLRLDDCQVPRRLRTWQWVDYFPKGHRKAAYQRLLESLKLRAAKLGISICKPIYESKPIHPKPDYAERIEKLPNQEKPSTSADIGSNNNFFTQREPAQKIEPIKETKKKESQPKKIPAPAFKFSARIGMIVGGLLLLLVLIVARNDLIEKTTSFLLNSPLSPRLKIDSTQISPKDGMTMDYVPAGEFSMGYNNGRDNEKPSHTVYLDAFWIDRTEVTNKMYALCVSSAKCSPPHSSRSHTRQNYYGNPEYDNFPVLYVTWDDASAYCAWAGRQLPTEAQWEKAARGTDGRLFPWGNADLNSSLLNYNNMIGDTTPVGNFPSGVSPYGALDMAGNVWEWMNDWYDASYYTSSPSSNPTGPESGTVRVIRGGSWYDRGELVRSSTRGFADPGGIGSDDGGFRCASSQP